jgi:hypothetical protein
MSLQNQRMGYNFPIFLKSLPHLGLLRKTAEGFTEPPIPVALAKSNQREIQKGCQQTMKSYNTHVSEKENIRGRVWLLIQFVK